MNKFLLAFLIAMTFQNAHAQGVEHGNGGDEEIQFKHITDQLQSWIKKIPSAGDLAVKLESSLEDAARVREGFLTATSNTEVRFTGDAVLVAGNSRICRNEPQARIILCNRDEWRKTQGDVRYAIVFHEYLGIAKIETNVAEHSRYPFSSKILNYVYSIQKYELGLDAKPKIKLIPAFSQLKNRFKTAKKSGLPLELDFGHIDLQTGNQTRSPYICTSRTSDGLVELENFKFIDGIVVSRFHYTTQEERRTYGTLLCSENLQPNTSQFEACVNEWAQSVDDLPRQTYADRLFEVTSTRMSVENNVLKIRAKDRRTTEIVRDHMGSILFHQSFGFFNYYGICQRF